MDKTRCPFNYVREYPFEPCTCSLRCAILGGQKPRVRMKAPTRMHNNSVPCDAVPGDLVVGNRGAAALVEQPRSQFGGLAACIALVYVGNYYEGARPAEGCKTYDFSGGTRP